MALGNDGLKSQVSYHDGVVPALIGIIAQLAIGIITGGKYDAVVGGQKHMAAAQGQGSNALHIGVVHIMKHISAGDRAGHGVVPVHGGAVDHRLILGAGAVVAQLALAVVAPGKDLYLIPAFPGLLGIIDLGERGVEPGRDLLSARVDVSGGKQILLGGRDIDRTICDTGGCSGTGQIIGAVTPVGNGRVGQAVFSIAGGALAYSDALRDPGTVAHLDQFAVLVHLGHMDGLGHIGGAVLQRSRDPYRLFVADVVMGSAVHIGTLQGDCLGPIPIFSDGHRAALTSVLLGILLLTGGTNVDSDLFAFGHIADLALGALAPNIDGAVQAQGNSVITALGNAHDLINVRVLFVIGIAALALVHLYQCVAVDGRAVAQCTHGVPAHHIESSVGDMGGAGIAAGRNGNDLLNAGGVTGGRTLAHTAGKATALQLPVVLAKLAILVVAPSIDIAADTQSHSMIVTGRHGDDPVNVIFRIVLLAAVTQTGIHIVLGGHGNPTQNAGPAQLIHCLHRLGDLPLHLGGIAPAQLIEGIVAPGPHPAEVIHCQGEIPAGGDGGKGHRLAVKGQALQNGFGSCHALAAQAHAQLAVAVVAPSPHLAHGVQCQGVILTGCDHRSRGYLRGLIEGVGVIFPPVFILLHMLDPDGQRHHIAVGPTGLDPFNAGEVIIDVNGAEAQFIVASDRDLHVAVLLLAPVDGKHGGVHRADLHPVKGVNLGVLAVGDQVKAGPVAVQEVGKIKGHVLIFGHDKLGGILLAHGTGLPIGLIVGGLVVRRSLCAHSIVDPIFIQQQSLGFAVAGLYGNKGVLGLPVAQLAVLVIAPVPDIAVGFDSRHMMLACRDLNGFAEGQGAVSVGALAPVDQNRTSGESQALGLAALALQLAQLAIYVAAPGVDPPSLGEGKRALAAGGHLHDPKPVHIEVDLPGHRHPALGGHALDQLGHGDGGYRIVQSGILSIILPGCLTGTQLAVSALAKGPHRSVAE